MARAKKGSRGSKKSGMFTTDNAVFMWPTINTPYIYFSELTRRKEDEYLPYKRFLANRIGKYAAGVMRTDRGVNDEHYEQMYAAETAKNFLKAASESERNKEIAFLDFCINTLNKDKAAQKFKDQFEKLKRNLLSDGIRNEDYLEFINILNESIQDIQDFKARLEAIVSKNEFYRDNRVLERNIVSEASTILNTLTSRRRKFGLSQEGIINMLTINFFQNGKGAQYLEELQQQQLSGYELGSKFATMSALVQRELAQYIHDHRLMQKYTSQEMSKKEFQDLYFSLANTLNNGFFQSNTWDSIFANNNLIDNISQVYNISKAKNRLKASKKTEVNAEVKDMMSQLGLDDIFKNTTLINALRWVKISPIGSDPIAFHEEIASLIQSSISHHGTRLGQRSSAIDSIRVVAHFDEWDDSIFSSRINDFLKQIRSFHFNDEDAHLLTNEFLTELNQLEIDLNEISNLFIVHETTKLYRSIEGGRGFSGKFINGFKGRNINLITYVNDLIEIGNSIGVDPTWLKFLAYNISSNAIEGEHNKAYLEEILALAGGLIMFDDFGVMAKEFIDNSYIPQVKNIHLYRLNGIFVPASYFLRITALNLEQGIEQLRSEQNGFSTTIKSAEVLYQEPIADENNPVTSTMWTKYKAEARKSTIALHFGANFISLVESLLKASP